MSARSRAPWARRGAGLALAAIIASCFFSASQAAACEVEPTIEHVGLTEKTPAGVVLEAEINPHSSATNYEFVIVQQDSEPGNPSGVGEPTPEGPRAVGGPIPAGAGDVTVTGLVTGLQAGYLYWYEVVATNLGGEARSGGDNSFLYYSTGLLAMAPGAPYTPPKPSACELEATQQIADRIFAEAEAERQRHAHEQEEQAAKEDAIAYASEAATLQRREEEEMEARVASHIRSCVVPALKGDTLRAARRAINEAHCHLGSVRKPRHHQGVLIVISQSHRHGETLAGGTAIAIKTVTARSNIAELAEDPSEV